MISIQIAGKLLAPSNLKPISRIYIDKDGHIFLLDYENTELVIPPLAKALYLLYLNHAEGISFYDLGEYYEELLGYYQKTANKMVRHRDHIEENIQRLIDRQENSINEKCTQIKKCIQMYVPEKARNLYYIQGVRGGIKKIALSSEYIHWELRRNKAL